MLNIDFLQRIHRLFWVKSHSPQDFSTVFGTSDSPNVCWIKCTGDWTISQNSLTLFSGQWRLFLQVPNRTLSAQLRRVLLTIKYVFCGTFQIRSVILTLLSQCIFFPEEGLPKSVGFCFLGNVSFSKIVSNLQDQLNLPFVSFPIKFRLFCFPCQCLLFQLCVALVCHDFQQ